MALRRGEMEIRIRPVELKKIAKLRESFRAEADCQVVCYSILPRGLAQLYIVIVDGGMAGYGGV